MPVANTQLEVKKTALAESVRRVNNLEKANGTHMTHFADVSKKNEALEKVRQRAKYYEPILTPALHASASHPDAHTTIAHARSRRAHRAAE